MDKETEEQLRIIKVLMRDLKEDIQVITLKIEGIYSFVEKQNG